MKKPWHRPGLFIGGSTPFSAIERQLASGNFLSV
jgi:hypothetical protein